MEGVSVNAWGHTGYTATPLTILERKVDDNGRQNPASIGQAWRAAASIGQYFLLVLAGSVGMAVAIKPEVQA
jgi:hypothetical protein